jgi:hypothetical protein
MCAASSYHPRERSMNTDPKHREQTVDLEDVEAHGGRWAVPAEDVACAGSHRI